VSGDSIVDLRSDTVTKPTLAMRQAMAEAEVGDDVYGEDPTVNRLQERAAEIFEFPAALFMPSGAMGNLVAIKTWTHHGGEVICEERAHVNQYELSSMAAIAGCLPRTTFAADGVLTWGMIEPLIQPRIYYRAKTALIVIENTHNMAGGTVTTKEITAEICSRANDAELPVHLDGARIFNAAEALGCDVAELARGCDSVMFSLSKGLGAPVGSILLGPPDFIEQARILRKMLGGGMRQAGVLAAAGLVALEESPKILHRDHAKAKRLAEGLAEMPGITLAPERVVTNIVIFGVQKTGRTADEMCTLLGERGVLASVAERYAVRMVTHYDVTQEGINRALAAASSVFSNLAAQN
jgi:threonine aldolase